jgi:hypothetical protein
LVVSRITQDSLSLTDVVKIIFVGARALVLLGLVPEALP